MWWACVTPGYWLDKNKSPCAGHLSHHRTPHVALYVHAYPLGLEPTGSYQHVLHFYFVTWRMFHTGMMQYMKLGNWVSSQAQVSGVWFSRSLLLLDCGSVPRVGVCVNPSFHFSGISACEYSCWVIWDLYAVWETATRFPKGAMPCYIPTSSVGSSEVHIPASLWCSQGFPEQFCWVWSHLFTCICLKARDVEHLTWLLVILVGMRWYLTVALIFIFPWWLMVSFHVLMAYLHVIFSGITVQTLSSF